jgi:hypothetical protein
MLTKTEILDGVRELAGRGELREDEVTRAFREGLPEGEVKATTAPRFDFSHRLNLAEVLYYVGGGIVVLGIGILIEQNWSALNDFTRVLSTLGSGVLAYVIGVLLSRSERTQAVGAAFDFIAAAVIPIGLFVVFKVGGQDITTFGTQNLIFAILLGLYLATWALWRQSLFVLFCIIFGSCLYLGLVGALADGAGPVFGGKLAEYAFLLLGTSYLFIGFGLRQSKYRALTGAGWFFGMPMILGAAMILGDFKPNANLFWEFLFPVLALAAISISVWLKSRSFLVWGTLFLMGYIVKITAEYFASDLGWPLALVVAGFAVIGIGFLSLNIKQIWGRKTVPAEPAS